jgi:hypothetical protein
MPPIYTINIKTSCTYQILRQFDINNLESFPQGGFFCRLFMSLNEYIYVIICIGYNFSIYSLKTKIKINMKDKITNLINIWQEFIGSKNNKSSIDKFKKIKTIEDELAKIESKILFYNDSHNHFKENISDNAQHIEHVVYAQDQFNEFVRDKEIKQLELNELKEKYSNKIHLIHRYTFLFALSTLIILYLGDIGYLVVGIFWIISAFFLYGNEQSNKSNKKSS